jgi:hypothetical protein
MLIVNGLMVFFILFVFVAVKLLQKLSDTIIRMSAIMVLFSVKNY